MQQFTIKPLVIAIIVAGVLLGGAYLLFGLDPSNDQVAQSHRSYELEITSDTKNIKPGQPVKISYKVKNDLGDVLKDFETVHEKIMHFILARKDLQQFQHLHPEYNQATGEFSVNVTFPTDGPYRLFPDFTPGKNAENSQLLPVTLTQDVNVGNLSNYKAVPISADAASNKNVDGYNIIYSIEGELQAQMPASYTLSIEKNGKKVTNLEPYLGAMGHSVILKAETLDFIHAHAESASAGSSNITFSTTFPEPGLYKTFTQFQHQGRVLTSEYVFSVSEMSGDMPMGEDGMENMNH